MNILIFGASGKVGKLVVKKALENGHKVTAFVRNASRISLTDNNLRIVEGSVTNVEDIKKVIIGHDVVISTVGHKKGTPNEMMKTFAEHIVLTMGECNMKRFITLLGAGVHDPKDPPASFGRKSMLALMKVFAGRIVHDSEDHSRIIRSSNLDWTIVRPTILSDEQAKGEYRTGYMSPGFTSVSREDLAAFMIKAAEKNLYIKEAPIITY